MNLIQFVISLVLAIALAGLSVWNAVAAQTNGELAAEQTRLQGVLANARTQQNVLEQVLQRTALVGQRDPEIIALLGKYGLSVKSDPETNAATGSAAPAR